jgi:hypothetical protein
VFCNNIQIDFVNERYILESVVSAHEIIHDTVKNNRKDMILELDYKKAYDRISWSFLDEMMEIIPIFEQAKH